MESISLTSTGAESLEALKQEFLRNELARNNETHGAYLRAIQHLFRGWMPEGSAVAIPDSQPVAALPSSRNSIWEQADLLELCGGSVSRILGSDYSAIDALRQVPPSNAPVHVYFSSDQDDGASGPARTL